MNAIKYSSLGYLSGLLVIGAASALIGCGGNDDSADPAHPGAAANAGTAGQPDVGTGGSSAGNAGSGATATGGSSGTKSGTGGSSSSNGGSSGNAGTSSTGGSSGSSGNAGTTSTGGSSGSAGTGGHTVQKPTEEAFSTDAFADDLAPARCKTGDPSCTQQPLLSAELTLAPRDELSLLAPAQTGATGATLDDATANFANMNVSAMSSLADLKLVDTTSGNVDDDGNAELIAAGFKADGSLVIRVVDSHTASGAQAQRQLFTTTQDIPVTNVTDGIASNYTQASVHVGDLDQDGRDEIVLTAKTQDGRVVVRLFDDATTSFQALPVVYTSKGTAIAATLANVDTDPAPELAILVDTGLNKTAGGNIEVWTLDDAAHAFAVMQDKLVGKTTGLIRGANLTTSNLQIVAGNFDADAQDEIIVLADGYDSGDGSVDAIEPALFAAMLDSDVSGTAPVVQAVLSTQREFPLPHQNSANGGYPNQSTPGWRAIVADTRLQVPNAASSKTAGKLTPTVDELFVVESREPENQSSGYDIVLTHETFGSSAWSQPVQELKLMSNVMSPSFSLTSIAGNLDNLASDVVVAVRQGTTVTPIRVHGVPNTATATTTYTLEQSTLPTLAVTNESAPVFATGGDYDGDALRVRFLGTKGHALMNPKPFVVLAAPPVNDQIDQDQSSSSTEYTVRSSDSKANGTEYSVSDTLTLSTDIDLPIIGDFVGVTASYSMSQQFTKSQTTTDIVTYSYGTTFAYPFEGVIFDGTLCERYEYQIVSAGDTQAIGGKITINEPIATKTFAWPVDDYNSILADGMSIAAPIDASVLTHTVGDPASYPTESNAGTGPNAWKSAALTVGGQGSTQTVEIDLEHDQANSVSTTDSSTAGGGSTGLVGIQYTKGWDSTGSYEWTTGKGLAYQGSVGGIGKADLGSSYSFGLWIHNATLADQTVVQVIDYFTDAK